MSLFVDKHRPKSLEELDFHPLLTERIRALAQTADFPHCLFYGPSGAGKKTRITAALRELYGPGVEKLRIEQRVFLTPSKRKLDVNIVQSNYHIELTPADVSQWDRTIIQDILKEIAGSQNVDASAKKKFKVVVVNEADHLTRDAQAALRRTMEKYTLTMRLILCANSTSKIIGPIRSRCLLLRVGAPSDEEVTDVLQLVAKKERFLNPLPDAVALLIAQASQGNLRRALLSLEALHAQDATFSSVSAKNPAEAVPIPDWETYIKKLATLIVTEQSPEKLMEARSMLYELLVHLIPPSLIISTLAKRLVEKVDSGVKPDIIHWAATYEHRIRLGNKPIFHLEAFVAKIMSIYKNFLLGLGF